MPSAVRTAPHIDIPRAEANTRNVPNNKRPLGRSKDAPKRQHDVADDARLDDERCGAESPLRVRGAVTRACVRELDARLDERLARARGEDCVVGGGAGEGARVDGARGEEGGGKEMDERAVGEGTRDARLRGGGGEGMGFEDGGVDGGGENCG